MDNKIHARFGSTTNPGRNSGFVNISTDVELTYTLSTGEVRSAMYYDTGSCGKNAGQVESYSLQAAVYLLKRVNPTKRTLVVHLNSEYQNIIVRNAWAWRKDGWIKLDGSPVKNQLHIARYLDAVMELAKIFGDVEMVFHE